MENEFVQELAEDTGDGSFDMERASTELSIGLGFEEEAEGEEAEGEEAEKATEPTEEKAAEATTEETKPAAEKAKGEQAVEAATETATEVPKTWRKEAAAVWNDLPPTAQAEILKREEDIHKGIELYREEASFGSQIRTIIKPHEALFREAGIDPVKQMDSLLQAHVALSTQTPSQRLQSFAQLAASYNVDLGELLDSGAAEVTEVSVLRNELQMLQSSLRGLTEQQQNSRRTEVEAEITKFAADPANAYFDEVSSEIALLLKSGAAKNLTEAYEKAVWTSPTVRAKELARQQELTSAKQKEDAAKKLEAVKKATSVNLKSKAKTGSATTPIGSMEDTIAETLANIKARG